jgi:hypothetical protein
VRRAFRYNVRNKNSGISRKRGSSEQDHKSKKGDEQRRPKD